MSAILSLSDVGKSYGNVHALRDVSLSVRQGEVTCVLGDNGAGKSTLIKIVSGLHAHTSGSVLLDDAPVHFGSPREAQANGIATVYFGARDIILDEPTAALGVKQSGVLLRYVVKARDAGLGVIFITHNPHHAYLVGNHFVILKLGRVVLDAHRDELTLEQLTAEMAGGDELTELSHELRGADPGKVVEPASVAPGSVDPPDPGLPGAAGGSDRRDGSRS